jgi:hypothetical protein
MIDSRFRSVVWFGAISAEYRPKMGHFGSHMCRSYSVAAYVAHDGHEGATYQSATFQSKAYGDCLKLHSVGCFSTTAARM